MSTTNKDTMLMVARICIAFLFVWSGVLKATNPGGFASQMAHEGMPAPGLFPWLAFVIEVGGGLAILLGAATRTVAVLFIPYILVASLIDHRFWEMTGPAWNLNRVQFGKNVAMLPSFMLLACLGAGRWSIDALLGRTKAVQPA